jgi:hypothetical protein
MCPLSLCRILKLALVVSVAFPAGLLAQTSESARVTEYPAVRLSYDDLSKTATTIHRFVQKANAGAECIFPSTEHVTVDDGISSISVSGDFSSAAFSSAPQVAYSVEYYYSGCPQAPISEVTLSLSDSFRKLAVKGRSADEVQALTTVATEDLSQFQASLGGSGFRTAGFLALMLLAAALISSGAVAFISASRAWGLAWVGVGLGIYLVLEICPWGTWFPGTAVYSGSASFLVRNEPVISLFGVLLPVVTGATSVAIRLLRHRAPSAGGPGTTPTATSRRTRSK